MCNNLFNGDVIMIFFKNIKAGKKDTIVVNCAENCSIILLNTSQFSEFLTSKNFPTKNEYKQERLPAFLHPPYDGEWYVILNLLNPPVSDKLMHSIFLL
jgi:hypothetical protein